MLTAHDVLPREPRPGQLAAQRRLYDRFDAIVVHSEHGRLRLVEELGADAERVHVIPHGVFTHLAQGISEGLTPALAGMEGETEIPEKGDAPRARGGDRPWKVPAPESSALSSTRLSPELKRPRNRQALDLGCSCSG